MKRMQNAGLTLLSSPSLLQHISAQWQCGKPSLKSWEKKKRKKPPSNDDKIEEERAYNLHRYTRNKKQSLSPFYMHMPKKPVLPKQALRLLFGCEGDLKPPFSKYLFITITHCPLQLRDTEHRGSSPDTDDQISLLFLAFYFGN